jgi:uncharacterized membrane protein YvbJ
MYCPQCGANNDDRSQHCTQCGTRLGQGNIAQNQPVNLAQPPMSLINIPSYMTQSILVTLCCCLPLGIVGIFKANTVNRLLSAGDYEGAMQASKENKTLLWIAFAVGLVGGILYFFLSLIGALSKN